MSGIQLTYTIDDAPVRDLMKRLGDVDTSSMFDDIGNYMVSTITQRFKDGVGPDGTPWEPLAEATMLSRMGGSKSKKKRGGTKIGAIRKLANMSTLVDRGHLRDSITYNAYSGGVEFGSNRISAAIHQFGGEAGRGKNITIPARPYLDINSDDENMIDDIVSDFYKRALKQ